MHIKEIVIDGFKSYAQRTTVGPFDSQFNAITGLNGSGKSNILDSICFVLGISNLANVRANNYNELVYKNGQAGVTKATVSVVFDNSNKSQSPVGYGNEREIIVSRQIVVNGKHKYTINGINATNQKVADFFRSVQLNVNNPHFLIMQGRVTKVLNMKPPEILAMIEEASGTRMYEAKREVALKTIEKKEEKLREIGSLLQEEILPKLNELKKEKASYLQYQQIGRDIEKLTRLEVAYQYHTANQKVASNQAQIEKQQLAIEKIHDAIRESMEKVEQLTAEAKELEAQQNLEKKSALKDLETAWNDRRNEEAKAVSAFEHSAGQEKDIQKKLKDLTKNLSSEESNLEKNVQQLEKLMSNFRNFESDKEAAEKEVEAAQRLLQSAHSGMYATESGSAATLHEQLNEAKAGKSKAESDLEVMEKKFKSVSSELSTKERELKNLRKSGGEDEKRSQMLQNEVAKIEGKLGKIGYNKERETTLRDNIRQLQSESNQLLREIDSLKRKEWRLNFDYHNPLPNFSHESVKGVLAKLFEVPKNEHQLAIEVAAGGKLFNVVVDSDQTAEILLKHGQLRNRVTFIPLNKISGRVCSDHVVKRAKVIAGKENAHHALHLVKFDPKLRSAMEFALGNNLVCNDLDIAKDVCYDSQVRTPVVTTGGDSYNPDGLLRGGSRQNKESVIAVAASLKAAEMQYLQVKAGLDEAQNEFASLTAKCQEYENLNRIYEAKSMELKTLRLRLQQSGSGILGQEVEDLKKEKSQLSGNLEKVRKELNSNSSKLVELEAKIKDEDNVKQVEIKKANERQKAALAKLNKVVSDHDKLSSSVEELKSDIEVSKKEISNIQKEQMTKTAELQEIKLKTESAKEVLADVKEKCADAKAKLDEKKQALKSSSEQINKKYKEMQDLTNQNTASKLEIQQLEYKLESIEKTGRDANRKIELLKEKHNWVAREAPHFGTPGTSYDFSSYDMNKIASELINMRKEKESLGRKVNMQAMSMLDDAEKRFEDLKKKKNTVLKDKVKLERTMEELDTQKRQALKTAINKVNQDFGIIFKTLLDYAFAELKPPAGKTELEGLEVRCRFGNVWKESLTELSGGQRSLVAISLILAMLKFNPAPLYILDEIDAALDLSHTQNIGRLIATSFQNSQFIVVSLKDGLFNNANVLFRTSFVEGVSSVSRQAKR